MNAVILAVGNELVTGQTVDTNSAYLSQRLAELGIETTEHVTVRDDRSAIAAAIRTAAAAADVVLVTGGLGPTADDLTRQAMADALGTELVLDEESLAAIEGLFRRLTRTMTPSNRIQAMVPAGTAPLANPLGTAPGIAASLDGAQVFVFPGVPAEMKSMFERHVAERIRSGREVFLHRIVHTFGTGESDIAARIADLMERGANPLVGTTAAAGRIGIRITARGRTTPDAEGLAGQVVSEVRRRLGDLVVGEGDETMASAVGDLLRRAGRTLATAESCTGGLIGELITDAPGASDYYLGGIVAYANRIKQQALSVPAELLAAHGAVSDPVAGAMAAGARKQFGSDWALAVTGIAGPAGGSEEKPVGLVFIGLSGPQTAKVHRHVFPGTRPLIRRRAAFTALNHLRLALLKSES